MKMAAQNCVKSTTTAPVSNVEDSIKILSMVSYNLHGLNQGLPGIKELMCSINPSIIMVQEHWQTSDNLYRLSDISSDYFVFGSSAMDARVAAGPLYGRPFGGTAILINNQFANIAVNIATSDRFTVVRIANWLLICVYLPCTGTDQRVFVYSDTLNELQSIISDNRDCDVFIGGDFNTDLNNNNQINSLVNNFVANNGLYRCDVLMPVSTNYTYINETMHCTSVIDYMLTSNPGLTVAFNVIDMDINLSDHLPILAVCKCEEITANFTSICQITYLFWLFASVKKLQLILWLSPSLRDPF